MKTEKKLTIGNLAKQSQVTVEAIKFYQKKGLLPKPPKPLDGFRSYPSDYVLRIQFIKRAQELGFTLKEINELLKLKVDKKATCGQVMKKTEIKLQEIENKIKDLHRIKKSLLKIKKCCVEQNTSLDECPILDCFQTKGEKNESTCITEC